MSILSNVYSGKILSIDPSTKSLAFAVINRNKSKITLEAKGKILFACEDDIQSKLKFIGVILPELILHHKPKYIIIEQTIYIQNPQTSRLLSYVVGHMMGLGLLGNLKVVDVGPIEWKRWLGYKSVSKTEIAAWTADIGEKEAKKKANFERKNRTKIIIDSRFPGLEESDYDIIDAIAIGLWAASTVF
mgnify:CR=1 FL=1|jgi:Holliday junction resolvasome RuvABC endonuclease subunit